MNSLTIAIVAGAVFTSTTTTVPIFTSFTVASALIFICHDIVILMFHIVDFVIFKKMHKCLKIFLKFFSNRNWFDRRDVSTTSIPFWYPDVSED